MGFFTDLHFQRKARDEGRERVASHNPDFMREVLAFIESLPVTWEGLAEDIRTNYTGTPPKHHNAWGSVTTNAIRQGMLVETGEFRASTAKRSHARRQPVYRRRVSQTRKRKD